MKHLLLFAASAILIVFAFANQNARPAFLKNSNTDTTLEGTWVLKPILPSDTATGTIPSIDFDLSAKKFTGNTGCNDMSGDFFVRDNSLTFDGQIVMTRKACEGYNEKAFIDNLTKTNHYKIVDGVLQLMNEQTILSKWTRKEDAMKNKT